MKKAIVTGGAGFAGYSLVKSLLSEGFRVLCPVRPGSSHNKRLEALSKDSEGTLGELILLSLDMKDIRILGPWLEKKHIDMSGCLFFHLAWSGERDNFDEQYANINITVDTLVTAAKLGASKIVITGSQAEYGLKAAGRALPDGTIAAVTEDFLPEPLNAYGAAKTAAMYVSRDLARHLDIKWNWVRIFSLYGECEHPHTMLSYLRSSLERGEVPHLSSCEQYWDYLDVRDAARALILVAEKGRDNEIYNLASGNFRPLREYTDIIGKRVNPDVAIDYEKADPSKTLLSLRPSVDKLMRDTGWKPEIPFN